jgi:hypothetical protein
MVADPVYCASGLHPIVTRLRIPQYFCDLPKAERHVFEMEEAAMRPNLAALAARCGADLPMTDLAKRAVCCEWGNRWPRLSITVAVENAPRVIPGGRCGQQAPWEGGHCLSEPERWFYAFRPPARITTMPVFAARRRSPN